jgi:hypothetical protein
MADDLDFFEEYAKSQDEGATQNPSTSELDEKQLYRADSQSDTGRNPAGRHQSGSGATAPRVSRPTVRRSTPLSRIALLIGIIALAVAGLFLAYAVAPSKIQFLNGIFGTTAAAIASAALALISLVLGIVSRFIVPRFQRSHSTGSWSIVCFVCSLLLLAGGFVVHNLFPTGIIKEAVRDEAPTTSVSAMQKGMEQTAGTCTDGWQSMGVSEYPGVSSIEACKSPRMAFIVFSNTSAASLYRGAAEQKIASLLSEYSDKSQAQGDWRILNGKQWMVFAQASEIQKLQKSWGGTISTVD